MLAQVSLSRRSALMALEVLWARVWRRLGIRVGSGSGRFCGEGGPRQGVALSAGLAADDDCDHECRSFLERGQFHFAGVTACARRTRISVGIIATYVRN